MSKPSATQGGTIADQIKARKGAVETPLTVDQSGWASVLGLPNLKADATLRAGKWLNGLRHSSGPRPMSAKKHQLKKSDRLFKEFSADTVSNV